MNNSSTEVSAGCHGAAHVAHVGGVDDFLHDPGLPGRALERNYQKVTILFGIRLSNSLPRGDILASVLSKVTLYAIILGSQAPLLSAAAANLLSLVAVTESGC